MTKKLIAGATLAGLVLASSIAGVVNAQSLTSTDAPTGPQTIEMQAADGAETDVKIAAETGKDMKVKAEGDDKECNKKGKRNKNKRNKEKRNDA